MRFAAAALLLALLAPVAAVADCAGLEPVTPQVSVETGEPAEPRIEPASAEEIRSRAAHTGTGLPGGAVTRGLTVDDLGAQARSTLTTVTRDGERCIAVQAIEATVRSRDVEVLVDRDYEPGSCQYRAILEHERQHVRINAEALTRLGELLETRLGEVADRWADRWVPAGRQDELQAEVNRALEDATRQARAAAEERHRAIDTPDSYAEVQASCDSW